jgi:hypothetical protein
MRAHVVPLLALTASALACTATDGPTAPPPTSSVSVSVSSAKADVSGWWLPDYDDFTSIGWIWLEDHWEWSPDPFIYPDSDILFCRGYALPEYEVWNQFHVTQDGSRILGAFGPFVTRAEPVSIDCGLYNTSGTLGKTSRTLRANLGRKKLSDGMIDGQFVGNDQVRLDMGPNMKVRATLSADGQTLTGTLRIWLDLRPYADPTWVESPIRIHRLQGPISPYPF